MEYFQMQCIKQCIVIVLIFIVAACSLFYLDIHYKLFSVNSSDISLSNGQVSVITFNVNAEDSDRFTEDVQRRLIDLVMNERPDILCFQELSNANMTKIKPSLNRIYGPCEELDGKDVEVHRSKFYSRYNMRNFKRYRCEGEVDSSDFNALEFIGYDQCKQQMNVMSAEFEVAPGRWVTVFSGHLRSSAYSTSRRSMDKGTSWLGGIPLYWRNYKIGKRIRDFEAQNVRRFVDEARAKGNTVIVAGDLNDWCGSDCLETLMGNDLKDAWWEGGRGFGWTYFGWHLRLRIDHILYSDELQLTDVRVVDSDLSDHKPLKATFSWKEQNND